MSDPVFQTGLGTQLKQQADLELMLADFCESYSRKSSQRILASLTQEIAPVVIGIGNGDRQVGREEINEQLEKDFQGIESSSIEITWHHSVVREDLAWIVAETQVSLLENGERVNFPARLSAIACMESGKWKWAHWHFSLPPAEGGWQI